MPMVMITYTQMEQALKEVLPTMGDSVNCGCKLLSGFFLSDVLRFLLFSYHTILLGWCIVLCKGRMRNWLTYLLDMRLLSSIKPPFVGKMESLITNAAVSRLQLNFPGRELSDPWTLNLILSCFSSFSSAFKYAWVTVIVKQKWQLSDSDSLPKPDNFTTNIIWLRHA